MANDLTALVPKLISGAQKTLRENTIMPYLVNKAYSPAPGVRGSTVDVPIPAPIPARAVTSASAFPTDTNEFTPTTVPIAMDQWFVADFSLNDKEKLEVMDGIMPMNVQEALKSLGNVVDAYLLGLYKKFYGMVGTPGTTPFATTVDVAVDARRLLNQQLAPMSDRNAVLDPFAEANALKLAPFRDTSQSSDNRPIIEGQIGRKYGVDWFMDQLVKTHTAGTGATIVMESAADAGDEIVALTAAADGQTLKIGDILTFAGHTQQYVVTANATLDATDPVNVHIYPALKAAVADAAAVAKAASHVANLMFNRNAIALASRPMEGTVEPGLGVIVSTVIDPATQLAMRLQIQRQYMQTLYSFDILFGANVIRPELGVRIAG